MVSLANARRIQSSWDGSDGSRSRRKRRAAATTSTRLVSSTGSFRVALVVASLFGSGQFLVPIQHAAVEAHEMGRLKMETSSSYLRSGRQRRFLEDSPVGPPSIFDDNDPLDDVDGPPEPGTSPTDVPATNYPSDLPSDVPSETPTSAPEDPPTDPPVSPTEPPVDPTDSPIPPSDPPTPIPTPVPTEPPVEFSPDDDWFGGNSPTGVLTPSPNDGGRGSDREALSQTPETEFPSDTPSEVPSEATSPIPVPDPTP